MEIGDLRFCTFESTCGILKISGDCRSCHPSLAQGNPNPPLGPAAHPTLRLMQIITVQPSEMVATQYLSLKALFKGSDPGMYAESSILQIFTQAIIHPHGIFTQKLGSMSYKVA